jgi:ABC-type glycerol-3-phosphate transport system permease component
MVLLPYIYSVGTAFKPSQYIFQPKVMWVPPEFTLSHFEKAFSSIGDELINSILVGLGTAVLSLIITIPAAYIFGRKEFPGKRFAFFAVISALMFPYILLVVPITDMWRSINLYNTLPGMWIAFQVFVTPFAIWILQDFFAGLPPNIEEAGQIYGLTEFGSFVRVVLPLAVPALVAVGFLAFLTAWNNFLFINMLSTSEGPRTATVVIFFQMFGNERPQWGMTVAMALITGFPPMALYMFSRHYLSSAFSSA